MDLSDPTGAVTPTLDGPVLAVLAVAGRPLTVGDVARIAARGSEIGIRRCLARLVEQGIVRATLVGRNQVHELNREHVAAEVAVALAGLRTELWRRMRDDLQSWRVKPLYACVFGSAARGDGDEASDIDVLLVRPPFPGEKPPSDLSRGVRAQLADSAARFVLGSAELEPEAKWETRVDALRDRVKAWTGNELQVVDLSFFEWRHPPKQHQRLFAEIRRERIDLTKARGVSVWPATETAHG